MLLALKTEKGSHMGSFLEAGKGKEKDSPLEPPENNTDRPVDTLISVREVCVGLLISGAVR